MARIFAVFLRPQMNIVEHRQKIEAVLHGAKNWLRFTGYSYFIATNEEPIYWYNLIRAILPPDEQFMVMAVDVEGRVGWTSAVVIEWFKIDHESRPGH